MKFCKQCNEEKQSDQFYVGTQRGSGGQVWKYLDSICKSCRKQYGTDRRRATKQKIVEYLGGKCFDCELVDDPIVYDCHHPDSSQKDFSPGKVGTRSFKSLQPELDKCVLLCAICHRKRHQQCV